MTFALLTLVACSKPSAIATPTPDPMASTPPPAVPTLADTAPPPATTTAPAPTTPPPPATTVAPPPTAASSAPMPTTPEATTVTGTVDGAAFAAKGVILTLSSLGGGTVSGTSATVTLTDFANGCATAKATPDVGNVNVVSVMIATSQPGSTVPAIPPGTYKVPTNVTSGTSASVRFMAIDAKGHPAKKIEATGGTLTITTSTPTRIAGSIDVKLKSGSLKGTFDAPLCPGLK